ncbi:MAG: cell division protein ZapA [Alphaproteobacteria bacterium]
MAQVDITIHGRRYGISCQDGQEQRVSDLARYVDERLHDIASAGAAASESHLLVLTTLMLADEIFDLRTDLDNMGGQVRNDENAREEEALIIEAIDTLAGRIDTIAKRIQNL